MNFPKPVNFEFPKREADMPTALMGVLSRLQNQMANLGSSFVDLHKNISLLSQQIHRLLPLLFIRLGMPRVMGHAEFLTPNFSQLIKVSPELSFVPPAPGKLPRYPTSPLVCRPPTSLLPRPRLWFPSHAAYHGANASSDPIRRASAYAGCAEGITVRGLRELR